MEKVVILKEDGKQDKFATFKANFGPKCKEVWGVAKKGIHEAMTFVRENKEELTFVGGVIVGGAALVKKIKPSAKEEDRYRTMHTYYDPTTGCHWRLRRELSNYERMELMRRRRNGEHSEDILSSMRVLL